ncbi:MAG: TetR/AcrR family transcriptional regulator [Myxococcota bacterium]|nr:TetR/AcrR family transcriptional regulator [Myxococcota bacterium]
MAPKVLDRDEKRRYIALAAVTVFGDKGFEQTRMIDVAMAAEIGKGTIYEYFDSKEALMEGALEALLAHMTEALLPTALPGESPLETLAAMTQKTVAAMKHVRDAYRFFLEYMLLKSRKDEGLGPFTALLTSYRQAIADLIEAGKQRGEIRPDIDAYETAAAFSAWFDGAIFHWMVVPEPVSLEAMGQRFWEMVIRGLAIDSGVDKK